MRAVCLCALVTLIACSTSSSGLPEQPVGCSSAPPSDPAPTAYMLAGGGVALTWTPVSCATSYRIERMATNESAFSLTMETDSAHLGYLDFNTMANAVYAYRVRAVDSAGPSPATSPVSSLSAPPPPEGPNLSINPSGVTLFPGSTQQFTLSNASGATFTMLEGAAAGSITSSGLYAAPARPGLYHVLGTAGGVTAVASVTVPRD